MIRRSCAGTAVCLLAALMLAACGTTARSDGSESATSAHSSAKPASTRAIGLRVSLDLALGAHTMLLARTTDAALGVRTSEFSAYGTALHADDATVAEAIAAGDPRGATALTNALTVLDKAALNDATAVYTKDSAGQQQAATEMTATYVPEMRSALAAATHASTATLTSGLMGQVKDLQALINAQGAGDWPSAYQTLAAAYSHQLGFGTSLALAMAHTKPRTYPGNPLAKAATLRDTLESQLQAQAYLLGMAESAGAGNRAAEQQAAAAAYASSTAQVNTAIAPAGNSLAGGVTGTLTQAQTAAAALATAAAQHDTGNLTTQQQALTQTFPGSYEAIAHGQLGVGKKQATAQGQAFGQALASQANAEGQQQSTPELANNAATAGARLGAQLSVAVATRFGWAFPTT